MLKISLPICFRPSWRLAWGVVPVGLCLKPGSETCGWKDIGHGTSACAAVGSKARLSPKDRRRRIFTSKQQQSNQANASRLPVFWPLFPACRLPHAAAAAAPRAGQELGAQLQPASGTLGRPQTTPDRGALALHSAKAPPASGPAPLLENLAAAELRKLGLGLQGGSLPRWRKQAHTWRLC